MVSQRTQRSHKEKRPGVWERVRGWIWPYCVVVIVGVLLTAGTWGRLGENGDCSGLMDLGLIGAGMLMCCVATKISQKPILGALAGVF